MTQYLTRYRIFAAVIVLVLSLLGGRLAYLQLFSHERYEQIAEGNAVRQVRVIPGRGHFYDRDGTLLAGARPTYTLNVIPRYFDRSKIGELAELLETPDSVVARKLAEARRWSRFRPSPLFRDLSFRAFSRVQERLFRIPGIEFQTGHKRYYPFEAAPAHTFGYVREVDREQLRRLRTYGYRMGDLVGQAGLEETYEPYLRGRVGSRLQLVNTHGVSIGSYNHGRQDVSPAAGYDLHLTLDAELQALSDSLFVNKRGGAVALDVDTGGILAITSKPDFSPSLMAGEVSDSTWSYLTQHWSKPMLNRATMSRMPPGSTWKPLMALMALQEGLVDSTDIYVCRGYHPFGGPSVFRDMHVHGRVNVVEAIQHSCNSFFFEMMYRGNVEMLSRYAHLFGFGEELPTYDMEQISGLIPDSAYFRRKTGVEDWGKGWTLSLGIGQGDMAVTPLQLARYVMAIANDGRLYAPHLVDYLKHPGTGDIIRPSFPPPERIPIEPEHFATVRTGMKRVMEAGTGYWVQIPGIASGAKTGTAQNTHGEDHSIFIMFAPFDDPEIALAVMVENAGYGATAAGPIASLMAEKFLKETLSDTPETKRRLRMALNAKSQIPITAADRRSG